MSDTMRAMLLQAKTENDALRSYVRECKDEIERLRAIVDRLPKDANGNTIEIQYGPIRLYAKGGHLGSLFLDPQTGWIVWPTCELGMQRRVGDDEFWPKGPEDCYSTREAAEAAARDSA